MISFRFAPSLLLRQPVSTPENYYGSLQTFLNDPHFRSAIFLASGVFYSELEKKAFTLDQLSEKEIVTLRKYINRYCFRPTPFGLFASISLANWSDGDRPGDTPGKYRWYCRADMTFIHLLTDSALADPARPTFEINPTIYRVLQEFRFIKTWVDPAGRHRDYQLQSIAYSVLLRDLAAYCKMPRTRTEIIGRIAELAGCTDPESRDYTEFLIDAQIIISSQRMHIAGKEQLQVITDRLAGGELKATLQKLTVKLNRMPPEDPRERVHALGELMRDLTGLLPESDPGKKGQLSVILNKASAPEDPAGNFQGQVRDGVTALSLLSAGGEVSVMSDFVASYLKHFEGQTLPLLVALDPEAGIGYQQALKPKNNPLLETLNIPHRKSTVSQSNWSDRHGLLLGAWLRDRSDDPVIRLEFSDLQKLADHGEQQQILGMSVLFRVTGEKVFIENAGGINAPSLMGRFTVTDGSIREAATAMARTLEAQNPDVIFAELLQLANPHTDNVNTREHIYRYEIPITAASVLPEEQQIALSDLYICIVENKVMLFSQKHQKIVIPRLSSAYNHGLNKLPLFRFLADIPYQYGQYHLGFDLRQFFPGQHFYPRVEYQQSILSLATWVISGDHLVALQKADPGSMTRTFKEISDQIRLPRRFLMAEGDQELVFDAGHASEITFFCECIRLKSEIVLKEFLDQPFIRQYNCYLLPDEPLVLPKPATMITARPKARRKYIPGSEWLYLKIYVPKLGADRLLLRIRLLLSKHYGHGKITEWFFIRYEDHAPHIRLRLRVAPEDTTEILFAFKAKLEDRIHQHLIREYQIDIYNRELERYAFAGIEKTERFFWASSELVICFLQQHRKRSAVSTYAFALCSTRAMISEFIGDPAEQVIFTLESFQQFLPEFTDRPFKVDLDRKYRELTNGIAAAMTNKDEGLLSGSIPAGKAFLKCLRDTHVKAGAAESRAGYLRSLIHMHLNRIFADESRKQEMIIYYLLHKYLLSARARVRRSVATDRINDPLSPGAHP